MDLSTFESDALPFPALLAAFRSQRSSCTVRVTDGVFEGELKIREGVVASADFGSLRGPTALSTMLLTESLRYAIVPLPPRTSVTVADDGRQATLLGLGGPQKADSASPPPLPLMVPPPLPTVSRSLEALEPSPELRTWAERASQEHVTSQTLSAPVRERESAAPEASVSAQPSMIPAHVTRDRTVWIVVAMCLPLLFALFYRGSTRSAAPIAPTTPTFSTLVSPAPKPIVPPVLAAGTPPSSLTAPSGALAPTVVLRVLVAVDGVVKQVAVQSPRPGLGPLEKQAIESVRGYRFVPATQDGKPVESWLTLPVPFRAAAGTRVLSVKGSETIGATLGPAWVRGFEQAQPGIKISLDALGSSTGFAGLLDGSATVAMSSRPVRPEELAFAERLGVQLRELIVAYDGIAVIVHPDNPLRKLDLETLAKVFAQKVTRWSELSGPDAPIHVLGRPSYSGTHTFFRERLLAAMGPGGGFGPAVEVLESPKDIVARVASDPSAIGYVSLGQVEPSVRSLPLASVAAAAGVAPTNETIRDNSYPIARPLYLYLRADSEHDARAWVDYALSSAGQHEVEKQGFVSVQSALGSLLAAEIPAPHVELPELTRIFFKPGSASLESASRPELMSALAALRAGKRALVVGHADSAGKSESNQLLAQRRAESVARELRRVGKLPAGAVEVEIAAASHPLASNETADGRKSNRRVDLIIQRR